MKKLRILVIADCNLNSIQAQDRDFKNWIHFLDSEKFNILTFSKGRKDLLVIKEGVNVISLFSFANNLGINSLLILLTLLFIKVDFVVISKTQLIEKFYLRFKHLFLLNNKVITIVVNMFPYEDYKFSELIVKKSNFIIAISKNIQKNIFDFSGRLADVVHLSYNSNIFFPRKRLQTEGRCVRVICVGSMQIRKQPFVFADIAKSNPEAEFIWIGEGYFYRFLIEKISEEKISNLKLVGSKPQLVVAQMLRDSDIFLFPSMQEGFPNAIVEAMMSGLAIIAYNSYKPEAVVNGLNGFVCNNVSDLFSYTRKLILDHDLLLEFKKSSIELSRKFNGINNVIEFSNMLLRYKDIG